MRTATAALLLALAAPAWAANYATCIVDKMPDAKVPATHLAVQRTCQTSFPGGLAAVKKGSGRGVLTFSSGDECLLTKAKDTTFQPAATAIATACKCLYDKPARAGELCASPDWERGVLTPPAQ